MSQTVEVGRSTGDILEEILRSKTIRIILVLTAVVITVLGWIVYQPQPEEGLFGKIWMVIQAYWYGFDVIVSKFVEDEGLAKIVAFVVRTGFTTILVLSLLKPLFEKETLLKIVMYTILVAVLVIVVYVALTIIAPVVSPIIEAIKSMIG